MRATRLVMGFSCLPRSTDDIAGESAGANLNLGVGHASFHLEGHPFQLAIAFHLQDNRGAGLDFPKTGAERIQ